MGMGKENGIFLKAFFAGFHEMVWAAGKALKMAEVLKATLGFRWASAAEPTGWASACCIWWGLGAELVMQAGGPTGCTGHWMMGLALLLLAGLVDSNGWVGLRLGPSGGTGQASGLMRAGGAPGQLAGAGRGRFGLGQTGGSPDGLRAGAAPSGPVTGLGFNRPRSSKMSSFSFSPSSSSSFFFYFKISTFLQNKLN